MTERIHISISRNVLLDVLLALPVDWRYSRHPSMEDVDGKANLVFFLPNNREVIFVGGDENINE